MGCLWCSHALVTAIAFLYRLRDEMVTLRGWAEKYALQWKDRFEECVRELEVTKARARAMMEQKDDELGQLKVCRKHHAVFPLLTLCTPTAHQD